MGVLSGFSAAVVGGDRRELEIVRGLAADGAEVRTCGCDPEAERITGRPQCGTTGEAADGVDAIVCPMPGPTQGNLYAPCFPAPVPFGIEVIERAAPGAWFFTGNAYKLLREQARERGYRPCNLSEIDELQILHSIPTAEGAVRVAIEELDRTLHGARTLVLGFGKIGRTLAERLVGMRALVTVAARRQAQRSLCEAMGLPSISFEAAADAAAAAELVYNTVPSVVVDRAFLGRLAPGTLYIDLASPPGGTDWEAARELGVRHVWARGLAGSAPRTAGHHQWETIRRVILEGLEQAPGERRAGARG